MGGIGSGNWYRYLKKSTVEDSLTLAIRDIRNKIYSNLTGRITWKGSGDAESSIGFSMTAGNSPSITLQYRWRDKEDVRILVGLQSTPTQFGGERWWFTCPLIMRGVACNRRVGKIHNPPGAKYFGCRKCHALTYRSCQESNQTRRLLGRLGIAYDPELVRTLFR